MSAFTITMQQLATRVYRILGILPAGGAPTADQFTQAVLAFNLLSLEQQATGPSQFRLQQLSLAIPIGVAYSGSPYVITPPVAQVIDARWVVNPAPNLYERQMGRFAYEDYMTLPNKLSATQSGPSVWCFDKQSAASNLYLWPLPANGGTLNLTVSRYVNPVANPSDLLDFPYEWQEGLVYATADRLMDDEGVAAADQVTADRIHEKAQAFTRLLEDYDRPASVFFRPYGSAGNGRFWRG